MSATRYRLSAEECRRKAAQMPTQAERDDYLNMAAMWDKMADDADLYAARWRLQDRPPPADVIPLNPDRAALP